MPLKWKTRRLWKNMMQMLEHKHVKEKTRGNIKGKGGKTLIF